MTTGIMDLMTRSGLMTPIDEMPTPALAVPYADPKFAKTMAEVTPMNPKNAELGTHCSAARRVDAVNPIIRKRSRLFDILGPEVERSRFAGKEQAREEHE
jgi:hypothetical protein